MWVLVLLIQVEFNCHYSQISVFECWLNSRCNGFGMGKRWRLWSKVIFYYLFIYHMERDSGSGVAILFYSSWNHSTTRDLWDLGWWYNLDSAQHQKESAVANELQKLVTENLGTCTCFLNGDQKMWKAFGPHFEVDIPHDSSTQVEVAFGNYCCLPM